MFAVKMKVVLSCRTGTFKETFWASHAYITRCHFYVWIIVTIATYKNVLNHKVHGYVNKADMFHMRLTLVVILYMLYI